MSGAISQIPEFNAALEWLRQAEIGQEDHDSCQQPFFLESRDEEFNPATITGNSAFTQQVHTMADEVKLPQLLRCAYLLLGSSSREFQYKGWTWLSVDKMLARKREYEKVGQTRVFDLAIQYIGMGHVYVLTLDTQTGRVFRRNDGGGNGYERDDYWKFIQSFDPATLIERQARLEDYVELSVSNPEAPGQKSVNSWS